MATTLLTHQESTLLKAYAILGIILHNFTHWLPNTIQENEYNFSPQRIIDFWAQHPHHWSEYLFYIFSHFGHYGVAIFLFLSGYGLVIKYETLKTSPIGAKRFLWQHIQKLWSLLLPALICFIGTQFLFRNTFPPSWYHILALCTFSSNLIPHHPLILGPWWYFSLMLQAYLLYCLLSRFRRLCWLYTLCIFSLFLQCYCYWTDSHFSFMGESHEWIEYLRYNLVGWLLPFCFGIWIARTSRHIPRSWILSIGSTLLLLISSFEFHLWLFSPIFAILALLPLLKIQYNNMVRHILLLVGQLSAWIFAFHPIVRHYLIIPASRALQAQQIGNVWGYLCFFLLLSISLAFLLNFIQSHLLPLIRIKIGTST